MNNDANIDENLWDQVTILRKKKTTQNDKIKKMRDGQTESVKKTTGSGSAVAHQNRVLDQADEAQKIETVSKELAQEIINARNARNLKQAGLAKALSLNAASVRDIENGKAILKNNKDLAKIKRFLNIRNK